MWAVMDRGTNSCRLLLAEQGGAESGIKRVQSFLRITRIGEGMRGQDRAISPVALERTIAALREFSLIIAGYQARDVIIVATQAVREATNRDILVAGIKKELNWELEILPGESEARLSYLGAVAGLSLKKTALVLDIGGGSTEFAWIGANGKFHAVSIAIGALRLFESPRADTEIHEIMQQALAKDGNTDGLRAAAASLLVGVGGTCTTAAAVNLSMAKYDSMKIQGHQLTIETIVNQYNMLNKIKACERLNIAGITKGREDIIIPGLQILIAAMKMLGGEVITISDQDLLYGVILNRLSPIPWL